MCVPVNATAGGVARRAIAKRIKWGGMLVKQALCNTKSIDVDVLQIATYVAGYIWMLQWDYGDGGV